MLINELFENPKRQLTEDQEKELDAFFESLTFEEGISFISEVAMLSELNPFEIGARKTSHTPKPPSAAGPGDETGKDVSVVGSGVADVLSGGSASANVAAARALKPKLMKPRGDSMIKKFINQTGDPNTPKELKKQIKTQTKAVAVDASRDANKAGKFRHFMGSNAEQKAAARNTAHKDALEKIEKYNKTNPAKKITDKQAGKIAKKAGSLAARIAARHGAATLMGGGVLSLATNLAALGWDAYDIWQWYKKNKHNNIKAI